MPERPCPRPAKTQTRTSGIVDGTATLTGTCGTDGAEVLGMDGPAGAPNSCRQVGGGPQGSSVLAGGEQVRA